MRFTSDLNPILFVRRESDQRNVRNVYLSDSQLIMGNPRTIERMVREFIDYDEEDYIYRVYVERDDYMLQVRLKPHNKEFMSGDDVENYIQAFAKKINNPV